MSAHRDIVIVGGRVAGAATALLLARRGHQVLVVDRVNPVSDTLSTHALMRTGVLQLQRWGVLDGIVERGTPPIDRITLGFGHRRVGFALREEYGVGSLYAPRRQVLDSELLEAAVREGAEFRSATRALDITRDPGGRVDGVVLDTGRSSFTMKTRFVVGADGMRSRIADAVGSLTYASHRPTNSLIYGYYEGVDASGYEFQFTPGVNVGLIPTNGGLVNVFAGYRKGSFDGDTESVFRSVLEHGSPEMSARVSAGSRIGRFRRSPGVPGFIRTPSGPGWALVGDAGFTKDPISAHGISDALRDAELAAEAIGRSLEDPPAEAAALAGYQAIRDRFALPLYHESRKLAAFGWDAEEASARLRTLSAIGDEESRYLYGRGTDQAVAA